jgi:hypothetical protein
VASLDYSRRDSHLCATIPRISSAIRLVALLPHSCDEGHAMNPLKSPGGPAVFVGRTMAACVHPYAAWRVLPRSARVVVVSAYAAGAYVAVLSTLLML